MVGSRLLSSGSLVVASPSNEDEGYFECTAVNVVGEERRVIEVLLQGNAPMTMPHHNVTLTSKWIHRDVTMTSP